MKWRKEYGTLVLLTAKTKYRFLWDWKCWEWEWVTSWEGLLPSLRPSRCVRVVFGPLEIRRIHDQTQNV